jgi:LuxR family maltose regulon positive regulatory protein
MQMIQTKLYRPEVNARLIDRSQLLARLNEGLKRQLILVCAPAGFGKSTLASQWVDAIGKLAAWVSLDEGDNHLSQFLSYLSAAVRRCLPEACSTLQALLTTAQLPDTDHLADLLVEELNALTAELILVLDDYQRIHSSDVHQVMRRLLHYLPPRLHLVILTRIDPPLQLARMRVGQQITEIRAADLRLGLAETRQFLQDRVGRLFDEGVIQSLWARTEGWIIGLQLAGISLQSQSPAQFLAHFGGSHRLLAGYLVEEVLAGLPEAMIEFLTRTALVDRFCASLGDALMADSAWLASSRAVIEQLEAQNLFVVPLDDEGQWYRYHDLFRDFLLHRLKNEKGEAGLAKLHQRASAWLAQAGLTEDALRHALAAGNEREAAELVEANLHPLLNRGIPAPVLVRWLDLFPEHVIQAHPGLLIAQIILFSLRWDMATIATTIDRATTLAQADNTVGDERRRLRLAVLEMVQGYLSYQQGDARRAIPLLQRGLNNLQDPAAYFFMHGLAVHLLAQAYAECGQREAALALLRTALTEATAFHRPTMLIFLGSRALIHLNAGELAEAAGVAEHLLALFDSSQAHPAWSGVGIVDIWRGWAHYILGLMCYEHNELEAAEGHWKAVVALRYRLNPGAYQAGLIGLTLVAQAQGATAQALAYAQAAREFALELHSLAFLGFAEALKMRLDLMGGVRADAVRRSQEIDTGVNQSNTVWPEQPRVTVLRVLLAEATPISLQAALQLADSGLRQAKEAHNTRQVIPLLALQALLWHTSRDTARAFSALEQALALGEPGSFTRTFLDLGAPMAKLLRQFERQRGSSAASKRLLAAFAGEPGMAERRELMAQYVRLHGITPLTQRELEMLALVERRLTVDEMAGRLVISPNTVKKHVNNIYTKLGVNNRRQAVAKAVEVGLLPSA